MAKRPAPLPAQGSPAMDAFSGQNGATGANAAASSTATSNSPLGGALAQLYQTNPQMQVAGGSAATGMPPPQMNQMANGTANTSAPTRPVYDPTYQGGQFPPGAPVVSGLPNSSAPSLENSNGMAIGDIIQSVNYIASLPLSHNPGGTGASVNAYLQDGNAQPGGMTQLGAILQGLIQPRQLNNPPPQAGLNMMFPSRVGGGGIL